MHLVDTHCHLDIASCFPDWREVLHEAREAGVCQLVLAGVYSSLWPRMFKLCREVVGLYGAPGLHPIYLPHHAKEDLAALDAAVQRENVVAIGEIGLDYHVEGLDRRHQQELFEAQLDIASARALPVLLHVRKAHDQVLATLRRKRFANGGIVHAYNGSLQQAEQYIGLGFKIAVGGTVTFPRALKIRRVAAALPLAALVLETDAPDIPPATGDQQRNTPANLVVILEALARLRGEMVADVARQTTENARQQLGLPDLG